VDQYRPIVILNFIPIYAAFFEILTLKMLAVPAMTFKGHWRSLTMSSFDISYTSSYCIVTTILSWIVSEISEILVEHL